MPTEAGREVMRRIIPYLKVLLLFGGAIFLTIAIALNLHTFSQERWQLVQNSVQSDLLAQLVQENVQSGKAIDARRMKLWKVQQSPPLYLFDTRVATSENSPRKNLLCGQSNCLFVGYIRKGEHYQKILNLYLDPRLPPSIPLWQMLPELRDRLPCFTVQQLVQQKIQASKLCFNHESYEIVETQYLPNSYE